MDNPNLSDIWCIARVYNPYAKGNKWSYSSVWYIECYHAASGRYVIYHEGSKIQQYANIFFDGDDEENVELIDIQQILATGLDGDIDSNEYAKWLHMAELTNGPLLWRQEPVGNRGCIINRLGEYLSIPEGSHDWYVRRIWRAKSAKNEPYRTHMIERELSLVTVRDDGFVVTNDIELNTQQIDALGRLVAVSNGRFRGHIENFLELAKRKS